MIATRILRPLGRTAVARLLVRFFAGMFFTSTFLFAEGLRHVGDPLDDGDGGEECRDHDRRREELNVAGHGPGRNAEEVDRDAPFAWRDADARRFAKRFRL